LTADCVDNTLCGVGQAESLAFPSVPFAYPGGFGLFLAGSFTDTRCAFLLEVVPALSVALIGEKRGKVFMLGVFNNGGGLEEPLVVSLPTLGTLGRLFPALSAVLE
jgi:hypothetical protein